MVSRRDLNLASACIPQNKQYSSLAGPVAEKSRCSDFIELPLQSLEQFQELFYRADELQCGTNAVIDRCLLGLARFQPTSGMS